MMAAPELTSLRRSIAKLIARSYLLLLNSMGRAALFSLRPCLGDNLRPSVHAKDFVNINVEQDHLGAIHVKALK